MLGYKSRSLASNPNELTIIPRVDKIDKNFVRTFEYIIEKKTSKNISYHKNDVTKVHFGSG